MIGQEGGNMKEIIKNALPADFPDLLRTRENARDRLTMLIGKLDDARQRETSLRSEVERLDNELAAAVGQGSDTGTIMRKIRAAKGALDDQARLLELSQGAVDGAERDVAAANGRLAEALQRAVIEGRNAVADRLQGQLAEIEKAVEQWRSAVYELADGLGVPSPAAGNEIVLVGLR